MIYIYPQAEPFFLRGTSNNALLFLHGFTASPSELYPTAKLLNQIGDLTVSGILLPGHGSSPKYLKETSWEDWYSAVEGELHYLLDNYEQVFIGGLSMGGMLALHAAAHIPGLRGAISINAPLFNHFPLLTASAPLMRVVKPYFPKKDSRRLQELEDQGRFSYDVIPVKAFQNMQQLRHLVMEEIEDIEIPLLAVQSLQDESVHSRSGKYILEHAVKAQARLLELPNSEHIATMGNEKDVLAQEILSFIRDESRYEEN